MGVFIIKIGIQRGLIAITGVENEYLNIVKLNRMLYAE